MHIVVAEVIDGECVGGIRCASARAGGFNFQACSFNHSAISPYLWNQRITSALTLIIAHAIDVRGILLEHVSFQRFAA